MAILFTILIVTIIYFGFSFITDLVSQSDTIVRSGGMQSRFSVLISKILSSESRMQILEEGSNYIMVGFKSVGGSNIFIITENFGSVDVKFVTKNLIHDFIVKETFSIEKEQVRMYEIIHEKVVQTNFKIFNELKKS